MERLVFEGPEEVHRCLWQGTDYLFERGGPPVSVPEDLAEGLMGMNPRQLPVDRAPGYDGPLASDYGMKVFRRVTGGTTSVSPAALGAEGGDR